MGPHTTETEVIIIGGGPAGSTLGCLLANGGHAATILERVTHPREHVGELLTPSVNTILHRIGLLTRMDATEFVRRTGVAWTLPRALGAQVLTIPVAEHPPPRALRRYGFNVERDVFDALLLQHARDCGVQVLDQNTVHRVIFEGERSVGVEAQGPDGNIRRITGRLVADASGRRCLLGTQLKLVERNRQRQQCALYAWFRGVKSDCTEDGRYAVVHLLDHRGAWGWQIPLRDGVSSIGIVASCHNFHAAGTDWDAFLMHAIRNNYVFGQATSDAKRIGPWHVVGDYGYRISKLHGCGWLLIGDAAGFIDPVFASGVDIAMHSAMFAYESILPLLLLGHWSDLDEQFALSNYEHRLRQGMAVWAEAAEIFYLLPHGLRRLVQDPKSVPAICRFLQGNPYALQNRLIDQRLVDQMGVRFAPDASAGVAN